MINVCLENSDKCESFKTIDGAIEFLTVLKTINVGDIVKVSDTGKCYSNIYEENLIELYNKLNYDKGETLKIIFNINKKGLGYSTGITKIDDTNFEVICKFDNNNKLLIQPLNNLSTYGGYYVIDKRGVKKVG